MKFSRPSQHRQGFTIVEVMVATALFALVGGIVYSITNAGAILYAKNFSINASGATLRAGLDRINNEVSQATAIPELVILGGSGSFTMSSTFPSASSAAGIVFDKYLGGPYVMESTATATSTSFSMKHSTHPLVVAPIPVMDDVVLIDGSTARSRVNATTPGSIASQLQSLAITLKSGTTTGVAWVASDKRPAILVRKVAFIVVANELRYYPTMEGVTNYLTAPYIVITSDMGTGTGESTPFALISKNGKPFLSLSCRVQTRETNQVLAKKESKEMTTSLRIDTILRPRNATY